MRIPCRISPFLLIIRSQRALSQSPCQSQTSPLPESINLYLYIYIYTYLHTVQDTYTRGRKKRLLCFFFSTALRTSFLLLYSTWVLCKEHVHVEMQREQWQKKMPAVAETISSMLRCIDSPLSTSWTRSGTFSAGVFFFARAFHRGW